VPGENRVVIHRQRHHVAVRPLLAQAPDGLDARASGAAQIEHQHVWLAPERTATEHVQVALLAYDLQPPLAIEQRAQVGTGGGPVTGKQNADRSLALGRIMRAVRAARYASQAQVCAHAITLGLAPRAGQRAWPHLALGKARMPQLAALVAVD
jgi:hypothetical protein